MLLDPKRWEVSNNRFVAILLSRQLSPLVAHIETTGAKCCCTYFLNQSEQNYLIFFFIFFFV